MQRAEARIIILLLVVLSLRVILSPIGSSLWLDEMGTVWAISGGFGDIVRRAIAFPQSILYCSLEWLIARVSGVNEIALRIPSAIAFAATLGMIYALGRKMFNRAAGLLAALAFVAIPGIAFTATDARPYALGLLATVLSMYGFYAWVVERRWTSLLLWIVSAALAIYFSYFFGVPVLAQVVYLFILYLTEDHFPLFKVMIPPAIIVLLVTPLIPQMRSVLSDRALHSYADRPWWDDLTATITPPVLMLPLLLALLAAWFKRRPLTGDGIDRKPVLLLFLWSVTPPLALFAVSWLTSASTYLPRYLLSCAPAIGVLVGAALSAIDLPAARISAAVIVFIIAITGRGFGVNLRVQHNRNWREAMAQVRASRQDSPVFIAPWFIELERMSKPDASYLLAPLAVYPAGGDAKVLPNAPNQLNAEYMEACAREMQAAKRFLLVSLPGQPTLYWLRGKLPEYSMRAQDERVEPTVFVFERSGEPATAFSHARSSTR